MDAGFCLIEEEGEDKGYKRKGGGAGLDGMTEAKK